MLELLIIALLLLGSIVLTMKEERWFALILDIIAALLLFPFILYPPIWATEVEKFLFVNDVIMAYVMIPLLLFFSLVFSSEHHH